MPVSDARPAVAHDVGKFYLKVSENWIYRQVTALTTVRSIFLARYRRGDGDFPWDQVHTLDELTAPARSYNRALREIFGYAPHHRAACRREAVRLVHAHFGVNAVRALPLARSLRVPLLASFYGRDMYHHAEGEGGLRKKYRRLFARGAGFIAEGPAAREQLIRLGCPAEKITIHRLGVELDRISATPRCWGRDEPLRLLMAARFSEKKGLSYGVDAFCRIAVEEPRLHLTVVGDAGGSEDDQRIGREIRGRVAEAGLDDRVRFTGFLSNTELHALAREHHLFVHPSVRARDGDAEGGHPVVITEMAASGMPIIATWHCDIPEVVVAGRTGWLCRERSVDDLVTAIREALHEPERLVHYGLNGRRLVEEKYDLRRHTLDATYAEFLQ